MDINTRPERRASADGEDLAQDSGDHRQHYRRRGIAPGRHVHLAACRIPTAARPGGGTE